jgi:para-nitrobenzyl esterase
MSVDTIVRVEGGAVRGIVEDGLHLFRNIPYAAPPFGERRFLPPQPPEPWDGVRDGTRPGPAVPQPPAEEPLRRLYVVDETGEDSLTLEVWTPDPGTSGLPVVVHIHGGGYVNGAGSLPGYTGRSFARDGVVHVGINYRLGIDGFLYLGEGHDNLGLRDQTFALEWVQRNIAAFGGDPARVTILGQSGGAVSVMFHLALPGSRGAFAGAWAQSGCAMASVDADEAMRVTRRVAKDLGVAPTAEAMSGVPLDRTVAAAFTELKRFAGTGLALGDRRSLLLSPFRGVHGTEVLPRNPVESIGDGPNVPLVAGTTTNEMAPLIDGINHAVPLLAPFVRRGLKRAIGMDRAMIDGYRGGPRHLQGLAPLVEAAWTDWGFRMTTIRLVERRPEPSWLYEFRWQREGLPPHTGAVHGIDNPFIRDELQLTVDEGEAGVPVFGTHPPQELATAMHDAAVRFIATGDPGWPRYDTTTRPTMIFDTPTAVIPDAAGVERELWDGRR